jgi:predicted  nucleic acid-binding Zn-ribbon protein
MTTENALWSMNWRFVQHINELTEEIVKLKQRENKLKDERKDLLEEMEELKMKYYVALADLQQERKKDNNKKKRFFKRRYKVVDL